MFMVALVGPPKGGPVSLNAGISYPHQRHRHIERRNLGGDSLNQFKEAAVMVATPTPSHPEFAPSTGSGRMLFTFCIAPRLARLAALRRCRVVRVTARSEVQARASLASLCAAGEPIGLSLVFVSRKPEGRLSA